MLNCMQPMEEEAHSSEGHMPHAAEVQRLASESLRVKQEFLNVSVECLPWKAARHSCRCMHRINRTASCMLSSALPRQAGGFNHIQMPVLLTLWLVQKYGAFFYLQFLAVVPEARGRGLGGKLLKQVSLCLWREHLYCCCF